jgi:general secretion pathway protein H
MLPTVRQAVPVMTPTSSARQGGFTLLELLIVLGIIALGVGLLMPNVTLTDNSAFRAEVRKAAATLSYARRLAIVQAVPVTAQLSTGPLEPRAQSLSEEQSLSDEQRQRRWHSQLLQLRYQDELQGTAQLVDELALTFFPQGGSTGGTLHFSRAQRHAVINVSAITGRISVAWDGAQTRELNGEHAADDA